MVLDWDILEYAIFQTFSGVVGVQCAAKPKTTKEAKPRNICFNCEGDHMIAACPEPRDTARIAKNRRMHADKNPVWVGQK